ncbi:MAG: histidine phosphatase family protein [Actinomycetota bacterium]
MNGTIHLVRHGKVENPKGVIYGRLPGFGLSELGQRQAAAAAQRLAERDIGAVWSSPLERAQETAAIIAEPHGLDIVTDLRLIESGTSLEGIGRTIGAFMRSPRHWWALRNPFKPSWGETFSEIRLRMLEAVEEALRDAGGREVVIVSHQTPVQVARLALAKRSLPPWLGFAPCVTGSVTSLTLEEGKVLEVAYFAPSV